MDEPYWIAWIVGTVFLVLGIFMTTYRQRAYDALLWFKNKNIFTRAGTSDPFLDSRSVFYPGIVCIPVGAFVVFFAASRSFGWGLV